MELIDKCLYDVLYDTSLAYGEKTAFRFRGESFSWSELIDKVDRTAEILQYLGVERGEHIGIWSVNSINWVVVFFAIAKCGAISVMINPNSQLHEMKNLLKYADIERLLIGDATKHVEPSEICDFLGKEEFNCKNLRSIHSIGKKHDKYQSLFDVSIPEGLTEKTVTINVNDTACMMFTSGTTSTPKGVLLSHYNIVNNSLGIKECLQLDEKDKFCMVVPLYHCFGVSGVLMSCVHARAEIDMLEYFQVEKASEMLLENQCTVLSGVPTMLLTLADYAEANQITYPSLKKGEVAGSVCAPKAFQRITTFLFEELMVSYGQTEASPSITFSKPGDSMTLRSETVGTVMEHMYLKIVDSETKKDLAIGEPGEIAVKGYNVMQGYYRMPKVTEKTLSKDGWLYTGDIGYLDNDNYLHFVGRSKEMIIRGGENISPYEIEEVLLGLDEIGQVKVIGVADEKYQEEICACIILKEDRKLTKEDILVYTAKQLSFFKQPKYIVFLSEFPLTSSGKVQVPKLRCLAMDELDIDLSFDADCQKNENDNSIN